MHEQRIVGLLYGQRGLMVGAVDPVVTVGTFMASAGAASPFDRLVRTAKVFETTFFGTKAEADRELARVHRLHQRTKGDLEQPAGPYPAGTPYDALDPKQMLWTLACIADSGQTLYEELVRPLTPARARGALAGLPSLGRALLPPARRDSGDATPSSAPGSTAGSRATRSSSQRRPARSAASSGSRSRGRRTTGRRSR